MLTLGNIELSKQYTSEQEELKDIRRYLFQLYTELNYRLDDIDRRIKELSDEEG